MDPKKKPKVEKSPLLASLTCSAPDDDGGKALYPKLYELLAPKFQGDTMTRQEGRLSIKADGSVWRLTLECPTEGYQTALIVSSLETALIEAEEAIAAGKAHWGQTWQKRKKNLPVIDPAVE